MSFHSPANKNGDLSSPAPKKYWRSHRLKVNEQRLRLMATSELGEFQATAPPYMNSPSPRHSKYKQTNLWKYFRRAHRYDPVMNYHCHPMEEATDRAPVHAANSASTADTLIAALDNLRLMESSNSQ